MDWLGWVILALVLAGGIAVAIWKVIQIVRMPEDERNNVIKKWLLSAVVAAEDAIKESGAGQEKMQLVIQEFQKKAPAIYKLMMKITKGATLEELIENALQMVKENFEK